MPTLAPFYSARKLLLSWTKFQALEQAHKLSVNHEDQSLMAIVLNITRKKSYCAEYMLNDSACLLNGQCFAMQWQW